MNRRTRQSEESEMDVQESVRRQFGPVAAAYATSSAHVGGPDLAAMLEAGDLRGDERALDVGAGAGHTALAFAPRVVEVVAVDLTEAMLETGRRLAEERGIANATFLQADAERLPFPDDAFDLVTSRYAAHHFPRPEAAAREWARVLKPGGRLLLVDVVSPGDPATDTLLNAAEVLRDPSHVRDHSVAQWTAMLAAAGLTVEELGQWPLRLSFASWVERMRTPSSIASAIQELFARAPASARETLHVESDGTFTCPVALLRGSLRE
jgi:ubiquinone/menaquinone biosynthesis C-methylase UbiE